MVLLPYHELLTLTTAHIYFILMCKYTGRFRLQTKGLAFQGSLLTCEPFWFCTSSTSKTPVKTNLKHVEHHHQHAVQGTAAEVWLPLWPCPVAPICCKTQRFLKHVTDGAFLICIHVFVFWIVTWMVFYPICNCALVLSDCTTGPCSVCLHLVGFFLMLISMGDTSDSCFCLSLALRSVGIPTCQWEQILVHTFCMTKSTCFHITTLKTKNIRVQYPSSHHSSLTPCSGSCVLFLLHPSAPPDQPDSSPPSSNSWLSASKNGKQGKKEFSLLSVLLPLC